MSGRPGTRVRRTATQRDERGRGARRFDTPADLRRVLGAAAMAALLAPAPAQAMDPIMPLSDVRSGMHCTGLSVVKGTAITSFNADVVDVLDPQRLGSARIIVHVSGPAVDATGVGEGFSGSPIYCVGADGVSRNIGAISEGLADYGNFTTLVRPIEAILAQPVQPPTTARLIGARSLAGPLTVSGLRPELARALVGAARKAGRVLITSPASPRATFPPQPLVPGAAVAVGLTSGDIAIGAGGTVAYADGSDVWAFGHEFEGSGRRSLFLQDAFVHTVVNNPVNAPQLTTYKLMTPGNDLGTLSGDGPAAITGRIGALPANFPLRVTARDLDTGRLRSGLTRIADESEIGRPSGPGVLGLASATAVAETVSSTLLGAPSRQSGGMCVTVRLRDLKRPAHFCNRYTVDGSAPNFLTGALIGDVAAATSLIDSYRFGSLHVTGIDVGIRARRGVRQAILMGASVRGAARRGGKVAVRLRMRVVSTGQIVRRTISFRLPSTIGSGSRTLRFEGVPGDVGADPFDESSFTVIFEADEQNDPDAPGPESPRAVARAIDDLHRADGLSVTIGSVKRQVYRDPQLRISGSARASVTIRRGRR